MRYKSQTELIHSDIERSQYGETSEALYLTSGFVYRSAEQAEARFKDEEEGYIYARYNNPSVAMFERRLAALEGAEACFATSSGMAAVFAALACQLCAGDHVIASRVLFGSCAKIFTEILPRWGIAATLVDGRESANFKAVIKPNSKLIFWESPANPTLELVDTRALVALAKEHGLRTVMDNAFASPMGQKPICQGVDIVTYSATKHIDGGGRCLGGAVLANRDFINSELLNFVRHAGPAMSPFNAWVLLKALESLPLRAERMAYNAEQVACFLEKQEGVSEVYYPGLPNFAQHALAKAQMSSFGSMLAFKVRGGKKQAFALMNKLKLIKISNNLGDAKSLITHPFTTTHRAMDVQLRAVSGIDESLLRLSVGLEDAQDLIADINQALG